MDISYSPLIRHIIHHYAYKVGDFTLSSGEKSREYIDLKSLFGNVNMLSFFANVIVERLRNDVTVVGGMTMGADALSVAIVLCSGSFSNFMPCSQRNNIKGWFSVRKAGKGYGNEGLFVGLCGREYVAAVIEDVVTTGTSTIRVLERCEEIGMRVAQIIAVVDREVGGMEKIRHYVGSGVSVGRLVGISEIRDIERGAYVKEYIDQRNK